MNCKCSSDISLFHGQVVSFLGDDNGNDSQKQIEIEQSCSGDDLIYRVAVIFKEIF